MTTHYSYGDFLSIVFVNVYQRLVVILQQWFHQLPSCSKPTTLKNHGVSSSVGARWHSQLNGKVIKFHGSKAPTRYICVYSFHKKKKSKAPTNTSWIFWERFQSYSNGKVTSKKESESRSDMTLWRKKTFKRGQAWHHRFFVHLFWGKAIFKRWQGMVRLPSGKHTKNYGKSPFSMGKSL